ncbi:hypothetical protein DAPPUDRAFT_112351 [Daphnia pulex]|uniref:Uncharacterized protein n=1 Tax=Daphnia pulex TaxID=6669 RepID=E9HBT0_DAPPU|nr:hypothetical protein DAPPUDRAFT_112351 [Daphnia pulex]|eukprot:EFX70817.1 hypothetical protein DAPPUDRAFT_112351 [Daphnia pulex]
MSGPNANSTPSDNLLETSLRNPPPRSVDNSGSGEFNWLSAMLPKIEITPYNEDPRAWHSFSRSFKELVHEVLPSNAQRIVALRNMLTSDVRQGFEAMLRNANSYDRVFEELHRSYEESYLIKRAYLHRLQRIRNCRVGDGQALHDLAAQVHDVTSGLQDVEVSHICSGLALELVIDKLPSDLQNKLKLYKEIRTVRVRKLVRWHSTVD